MPVNEKSIATALDAVKVAADLGGATKLYLLCCVSDKEGNFVAFERKNVTEADRLAALQYAAQNLGGKGISRTINEEGY